MQRKTVSPLRGLDTQELCRRYAANAGEYATAEAAWKAARNRMDAADNEMLQIRHELAYRAEKISGFSLSSHGYVFVAQKDAEGCGYDVAIGKDAYPSDIDRRLAEADGADDAEAEHYRRAEELAPLGAGYDPLHASRNGGAA